MNNARVRPAFNVLGAPYIKIEATIIQNGITNGKSNIPYESQYCVAPSAKKIATYIINQIFGSDLVTQTDNLDIRWLMPTFKESLELAVYQKESFIYIHKYDDKIYLESFKRSDIFDLVQKFDKVIEASIEQDFDAISKDDKYTYILRRNIKLLNGNTDLTFQAYQLSSTNEKTEINIGHFNRMTGSEYKPRYILPYEVLINIDLGLEFFKDSKKFLNEEMKVVNTLADEIEKTRTRIVTSQHYQSGDMVTAWKPGSTAYQVDTISVGKLQDYFTLLPGDKDHQLFNFLQGDIRVTQYVDTFKFYDYQVIQMAGLSPVSFGYEKDAYQNTANVDVSKNSSDMTVEAIKTQITPQINKLMENIVKAQTSLNITENLLPSELSWDFGANEKFDDMKKLAVMSKIQGVTAIPMTYKAKIILPILNKLIDENFIGNEKNKKQVDDLVTAYNDEMKSIKMEYGEV